MSTAIESVPACAIVQTSLLKDALAKFAAIKPARHQRAIFDDIRITAHDGTLTLYRTNLEISLEMRLPANMPGGKPGSIIANYKTLCAAVKAIKDDYTQFEIHPDRLAVFSQKGKTLINSAGMVDDYPVPIGPEILDSAWAKMLEGMPTHLKQDEKHVARRKDALALEFQQFEISAADLADALAYVLPGVAKGETRYALNGVYMAGNRQGGIDLASSNTFVLYTHSLKPKSGALPESAGFILHPEMVDWLSRHAGSDIVSIATDPHSVFVRGDAFTLSARRIDGMFPPYHDVIPAQGVMPGRLTVDRKALLAALKAARPNACLKTRRVDLVPNDTGDGLIVRAVVQDIVAFSTEIPAASYKWIEEHFNADLLISFLSAYPGDIVTFYHDDAGPDSRSYAGPIAVYDNDRLFVIMVLGKGNPNSMSPEDRAELDRAWETYRDHLRAPDQVFPAATASAAKQPTKVATKREPSFKAVVSRAKADPGYLSALLSALEIPAC